MAKIWVEKADVASKLATFFQDNRAEVEAFGSTVNQVFEAFVFASTVNWYKEDGWTVELVHPRSARNREQQAVRLKFSTNGKPSSYTYANCTKDEQHVHIRHGLRVATYHHVDGSDSAANLCLDVSVIKAVDLSHFSSKSYLENSKLITFGEAKHMSAFAELIAGFIGFVHEMKPDALMSIRPYIGPLPRPQHPAPFLYVSGWIQPSAKGIVDSMRRRGFDIDIYHNDSAALSTMELSVRLLEDGARRRTTRLSAEELGEAGKQREQNPPSGIRTPKKKTRADPENKSASKPTAPSPRPRKARKTSAKQSETEPF